MDTVGGVARLFDTTGANPHNMKLFIVSMGCICLSSKPRSSQYSSRMYAKNARNYGLGMIRGLYSPETEMADY